MGGSDAVRRAARGLAVGAAAVLAWSLGACNDTGYWAVRNATDLEIMEELRHDPWLAPSHTQSTYMPLNVPPESDSWEPGRAQGYGDRVPAPVPQVLQAQAAAAARAGWWPYYAACAEPSTHDLGTSPDQVQVLFTREMSAGVLARAELTVSEHIPGSGGESRTDVQVAAEVPSHRGTQAPAPEAVDVTALQCVVDGGQPSVGEPVELIEDLR